MNRLTFYSSERVWGQRRSRRVGPEPSELQTKCTLSTLSGSIIYQLIQSAERDRKRVLGKYAQRNKRERDRKYIDAPIMCTPAKLPIFSAPPRTVSHMMNEYFQNIQMEGNDCVARPHNWPDILYYPRNARGQPPSQHRWNNLRQSHYVAAATADDLQRAIESGLDLPVVVFPGSALSEEVTGKSAYYAWSRDELLDYIFQHSNLSITVQDHSRPELGGFLEEKTNEQVRDRFRKTLGERGCPWNCLECGDVLPGHKGPPMLDKGAYLEQWTITEPSTKTMNRPHYADNKHSKRVDRWLLVSEANSGSVAHVDIALGTWVACMKGKKTFWLRNSTVVDSEVWEAFQEGESRHGLFEEPWGRVDLTPGTILWVLDQCPRNPTADRARIFPPGTIHAVFTEEDTVCCGGHFLTPEIMDRFVDVLGQIESDGGKTNDDVHPTFFRVLENFIRQTLNGSLGTTNLRSLYRFHLQLRKYAAIKPRDVTEEYVKRRKVFIGLLRKENWINRLGQIAGASDDPEPQSGSTARVPEVSTSHDHGQCPTTKGRGGPTSRSGPRRSKQSSNPVI